MYTTLEEAKEELRKRWKDTELRHQVREYVGGVPENMEHAPKAVLFRSLATPNFEYRLFTGIVRRAGLKPLFLEHSEDRFCTMNEDKIAMAKMTFYHGKGKRRGPKTSVKKLIDFNLGNGTTFSNLRTLSGDNFIWFHKQLFDQTHVNGEFHDMAPWYKKRGSTPSSYYHLVMSLFVCNGILFENFLMRGSEGEFTKEVAMPAIDTVAKHFGLKPLIVRLRPECSECMPFWNWYPGELDEQVRKMMICSEI